MQPARLGRPLVGEELRVYVQTTIALHTRETLTKRGLTLADVLDDCARDSQMCFDERASERVPPAPTGRPKLGQPRRVRITTTIEPTKLARLREHALRAKKSLGQLVESTSATTSQRRKSRQISPRAALGSLSPT